MSLPRISETHTEDLDNVRPGANVVLCADDFAISPGVTRGICDLARARRLSATSAIVNLPGWESDAASLRELRSSLAAGLHLNLTLGAPLSPMPRLAPDGEFPDNIDIVRKSLFHSLDLKEVKTEIENQLQRFIEGYGYPPDFIDGHQHVHALPGVRTALIEVLTDRFSATKPLIRDPADSWSAIAKRKNQMMKAAGVGALAHGFGRRIRMHGFPINHGFAGFSAFDMTSPFGEELDCFFAFRGPRHLVMCHPGYVDPMLADLDAVVERRRQELDALFAAPRLDSAIWHVRRSPNGPPVDWLEALPV